MAATSMARPTSLSSLGGDVSCCLLGLRRLTGSGNYHDQLEYGMSVWVGRDGHAASDDDVMTGRGECRWWCCCRAESEGIPGLKTHRSTGWGDHHTRHAIKKERRRELSGVRELVWRVRVCGRQSHVGRVKGSTYFCKLPLSTCRLRLALALHWNLFNASQLHRDHPSIDRPCEEDPRRRISITRGVDRIR